VTRARIGLRFDPCRSRDGDGAAHLALLEAGAAAEACGLDVVWVAERSGADSLVPAALPVCAALAARTGRLQVASGLLPLLLHHPLRVAEDAAVLDGLSGGRFELGVGPGRDPDGAPRTPGPERAARFLEALRRLLGALGRGGEPSEETAPAAIWPPPLDADRPPLWIGAHGPRLQRAGARLGAGLLLHAGASPAAYLAAWRGERPARLAWLLPAADLDAVRQAARACLRESAAADPIDLVLAAPALARGAEAAVEAVEVLADRLAPALRALARG
jgi:alkanesulfonate monooxygenase SsuD/methylene tetrahydromethanopterin reductase-like flavin-dependent oxidoreductase (luciferase family)